MKWAEALFDAEMDECISQLLTMSLDGKKGCFRGAWEEVLNNLESDHYQRCNGHMFSLAVGNWNNRNTKKQNIFFIIESICMIPMQVLDHYAGSGSSIFLMRLIAEACVILNFLKEQFILRLSSQPQQRIADWKCVKKQYRLTSCEAREIVDDILQHLASTSQAVTELAELESIKLLIMRGLQTLEASHSASVVCDNQTFLCIFQNIFMLITHPGERFVSGLYNAQDGTMKYTDRKMSEGEMMQGNFIFPVLQAPNVASIPFAHLSDRKPEKLSAQREKSIFPASSSRPTRMSPDEEFRAGFNNLNSTHKRTLNKVLLCDDVPTYQETKNLLDALKAKEEKHGGSHGKYVLGGDASVHLWTPHAGAKMSDTMEPDHFESYKDALIKAFERYQIPYEDLLPARNTP